MALLSSWLFTKSSLLEPRLLDTNRKLLNNGFCYELELRLMLYRGKLHSIVALPEFCRY